MSLTALREKHKPYKRARKVGPLIPIHNTARLEMEEPSSSDVGKSILMVCLSTSAVDSNGMALLGVAGQKILCSSSSIAVAHSKVSSSIIRKSCRTHNFLQC